MCEYNRNKRCATFNEYMHIVLVIHWVRLEYIMYSLNEPCLFRQGRFCGINQTTGEILIISRKKKKSTFDCILVYEIPSYFTE